MHGIERHAEAIILLVAMGFAILSGASLLYAWSHRYELAGFVALVVGVASAWVSWGIFGWTR